MTITSEMSTNFAPYVMYKITQENSFVSKKNAQVPFENLLCNIKQSQIFARRSGEGTSQHS